MNQPTPTPEDPLRPHTYDGIQEYDKRLPNWWLYTLYVTIAFWVGYWGYYEWFHVGRNGAQTVEAALAKIEADKLASATVLDDAALWQMSRSQVMVDAGRATFNANCIACHLQSMRGKGENPTAIGPDLTDQVWIHGGRPTEVMTTVTNGVLVKGMPTWGPVLGQKKISEVVAYILSRHKEGEPVLADATATKPVATTP